MAKGAKIIRISDFGGDKIIKKETPELILPPHLRKKEPAIAEKLPDGSTLEFKHLDGINVKPKAIPPQIQKRLIQFVMYHLNMGWSFRKVQRLIKKEYLVLVEKRFIIPNDFKK